MEFRSILVFGLLSLVLGGFYFVSGFSGEVVSDSFERVVVPVSVHLVIDDSGFYSSIRSQENIWGLFDEANRIWSSSNIVFQIEDIDVVRVSGNAIPQAINGDYFELTRDESYDVKMMNVYFTQSLNNINGLALMQINSVLVADYTTVNDYRTLSHEFGHLLGLRHVDGGGNLMARGRNGEFLSEWEIAISREVILQSL